MLYDSLLSTLDTVCSSTEIKNRYTNTTITEVAVRHKPYMLAYNGPIKSFIYFASKIADHLSASDEATAFILCTLPFANTASANAVKNAFDMILLFPMAMKTEYLFYIVLRRIIT